MENKIELPQLVNALEIIGTLKTIELEVKTSRKGDQYIRGFVVVTVEDGEKVNEIKSEVFMMASAKPYKGLVTAMNEYKASDDVGFEEADKIKLNGNIDVNEYMNQNSGQFVQQNKLNTIFLKRVNKTDKDMAQAKIRCVVKRLIEKEDGDLQMEAYNVGWGPKVIPMFDLIIPQSLKDAAHSLYVMPNQMHDLNIKINRYVKVEDEVVEEEVAFGMGSNVEVSKDYVNNFEIIGSGPLLTEGVYTEEQIEEAERVRELAIKTAKNPVSVPDTPNALAPSTQPKTNETNESTEEDDDDIPF